MRFIAIILLVTMVTTGSVSSFGDSGDPNFAIQTENPMAGVENWWGLGNQEDTSPTSVYVYDIDPAGLRTNFYETGEITIELAENEDILFRGNETDIFGSRNIITVSMENDDPVYEVTGTVTALPLEGVITSFGDSKQRLTLGDFGLYGHLTTDYGFYNLDPVRDGERFIQKVEFFEEDVSEMHQDATTTYESSVQSTTSYVRIHVDDTLPNQRSDWESFITSAFNNYHSTWENTPDIEIDLEIANLIHVTDWNIATTSCTSTLNNYYSYLDWFYNTYHGPWLQEAHQFWAGTTFSSLSAPGCAVRDSYRTDPLPETISVLTGLNHANSGYSSGILHHRSVLSAHEFGHIYGAPHDYSTHPITGNYGLMAGGVNFNDVDLWFSQDSRDEINCRFYQSSDPPC